MIVYRPSRNSFELLVLKPNPEPGRSKKYYVVTGNIEKSETPEQAASREVKEEIGVKPSKIFDLHLSFEYVDEYPGETFSEYCFAAQVDRIELTLNEEHIDYRWLREKDFGEKVWWDGERDKLEAILSTLKNRLAETSYNIG